MAALKLVGQFAVLDISMPPLKIISNAQMHYNESASVDLKETTHQLFFKRHSSKTDALADRTLFIINVPGDATQGHFERLFRKCGTIDSVTFNRAVKSSLVVFQDVESIDAVFEMKQRKRIWAADTVNGLVGKKP
jgi:RNA recognition motif-containing protein